MLGFSFLGCYNVSCMKKFPQGFLWGAATAAHQVEGKNIHNDWWKAEEEGVLKFPSGEACNHYELYAEDFALARRLNHNCHRFSVEWSRIEPEEGRFCEEEIEHYRRVIAELKKLGIEPVVTLHHFTSPVWFMQKRGWVNPGLRKYFLRFVEKMAREFASQVKFWVTINEPMVYSSHSYLLGVWPPKETSLLKTAKVTFNMAEAHVRAYRLIHEIYRQRSLPSPMVGIAANLQAFEVCRPTLKNRLAAFLRNKLYNFLFIDEVRSRKALDYLGINYYSRNLVDVTGWRIGDFLAQTCSRDHHPLPKNSLGWDIYPEGLYKLIMASARYKVPIFITENGICTEDDNLRWSYIRQHLEQVHRAIAEGAEVLGYIYWSLIDNFEWDKGFTPRFGLVGIDYHDQRRTVRESAEKMAEAAKNNGI
ncbi:MAG: glycoside hydrolase family 1 protein [Candidatus Omnitrophica bacterium]|nr:glycoside hydrolase family 1 protein [Candidatus Omnitrophota bacterium]